MSLTERWQQLVASIRARPLPWAIGAGVGLTAVLAGGLAAAVISGGRQATGDLPSTTPSASASASASGSASEEATPSATPTATATATATASPTATVVPTPLPTPTPVQGVGGLTPPSWDIEGTWSALPPMPNLDEFRLSDAFLLDGTLTVIRWPTRNGPSGEVLQWSEDDSRWATVATETFYSGTDQQWARAGDGRIYTFESVLIPTTDPWQEATFSLAAPGEPYAGSGLDAGSDGRIYRPDLNRSTTGHTVLDIYDPETDSHETSAPAHAWVSWGIVRAPDRRILAGTETAFELYDPATDSWSGRETAPIEPFWPGAGYGPDGRLYTASLSWGGDIRAWDERSGLWSTIEPPPLTTDFQPRFLTGPDGRLWAIDQAESFVFTPDS